MAEGATRGKRYSVQQSDEELEIYEGRSIDALEVATAFGDKSWIQQIKGQQSRKQFAGLVAIVCITFAVISLVMAAYFENVGEHVLRENIQITEPDVSFFYDIELDQLNRPTVVSVETAYLPANTYADFEVNITSPNGVITELFEKTLWHETGSDSDGPWDESAYVVSNMFVPTVAGQHTLEILFDSESTASLPLQITLAVRRNHITPLWLVVYAVVTGVIGGIALLRSIM
jgi:hypothetical protein